MRKNLLISSSSLATAALLATAFILGMPVTAEATTYCENSGGSCTTGGDTYEASPYALTAGNNLLFETAGTATVANGNTVGTVLSNVASTGAGTGTLNITAGAGTTGAGTVGSATNYLGTVSETGGAIGNTVAFSGALDTNAFNVSTGTATVAGTAAINTATLTGGVATFNGASNAIGTLSVDGTSTANLNGTSNIGTLSAGTAGSITNVAAATSVTGTATASNLNVTAGSLTLGGTGNMITTLAQSSGTTTNLNGTTTVGTLNNAAGSTTDIAAATNITGTATASTVNLTAGSLTLGGAGNAVTALTASSGATVNLNGTSNVTTLTGVTGSTTNVGANTTIGTLTATAGNLGAVSVGGGDTLTLTNGSGTANARAWTFTTTGHTTGTTALVTTAGANSINLGGSAVTFNATNTGGATGRVDYTLASATGSGTVTGPLTYTTSGAQAGYTYKDKENAAGTSLYVVQTKNSNYTATSTAGSGVANQAAIGSYLQNVLAGGYTDTGSTTASTYLSNLEGASTTAAKAAIVDQAAPQTSVAVSNNLATGFMNVVEDRTGVLQGTRTAAGNNGQGGLSAGDANRNSAMWIEAFGSEGRQDTRGGQAGFDTDNGGFALGFEKKLDASSTAGVSISYGAGQYQSNEAGAPKTTSSDDYQASLYGSSYVYPNWYVDGQIGGGYHTFDEGNTYLGIGTAHADYHGWGYFGQIGTGYDFKTSSAAVLTPFAKLAYQAVDYDGYTETGAGALDRHVASDTAQTLTGFLGAKVAWRGLTYGETKFTPEIHAAYLHDFEQEGLSTTANFVGTGSASTFATTGQGLAKDGYTIGLGVNIARANGWDFNANYDFEGRDGYAGNSGILQAKYAF